MFFCKMISKFCTVYLVRNQGIYYNSIYSFIYYSLNTFIDENSCMYNVCLSQNTDLH